MEFIKHKKQNEGSAFLSIPIDLQTVCSFVAFDGVKESDQMLLDLASVLETGKDLVHQETLLRGVDMTA